MLLFPTDDTSAGTGKTGDPFDTYVWSKTSGNINLLSQSNGVATFGLPSGFTTSTVSLVATGTYPQTSSTSTFIINQSSGNICSLSGVGTTPLIYIATNFIAPQSGCSSTIVYSGTNITFVGNNITLNPGFEVQLGGTFNALTK